MAGAAGEATDTPEVVASIVQGLADSKIDELTSRISQHEGHQYSYHLKKIDYLGTVQRDGHRYTIAAAKFLRSSAKGSEYPPARGHSFLIIFDETFRIASYSRCEWQELFMEGNVLKAGNEPLADFGSTDPLVRYRGWLLDGSHMPYPFADKISEKEWESGSFKK